MQTSNAYGICLVEGHRTHMYVTLQEKPIKQVNETIGFTRQLKRKYVPYSSTYNMGWRDHLNLVKIHK